MAVDIKQLRIGSHVEYEGKRVRIKGLTPGCLFDCTIETTDKFGLPTLYVLEDGIKDLRPIPITPELLKELGFEKVETFGLIDTWLKDDMSFGFTGKGIDFHFKHDGAMPVKYLHQAEAMLAIYNIEPIND